MSSAVAIRRAIDDEAHLVQRFTSSYRAKLAELIDRMNQTLDTTSAATDGRPDRQSIRWCVEAVDMVLASQAEFAKAMQRLADHDADSRL
jgi:hypothetical protein